jgi:hypothetical protein
VALWPQRRCCCHRPARGVVPQAGVNGNIASNFPKERALAGDRWPLALNRPPCASASGTSLGTGTRGRWPLRLPPAWPLFACFSLHYSAQAAHRHRLERACRITPAEGCISCRDVITEQKRHVGQNRRTARSAHRCDNVDIGQGEGQHHTQRRRGCDDTRAVRTRCVNSQICRADPRRSAFGHEQRRSLRGCGPGNAHAPQGDRAALDIEPTACSTVRGHGAQAYIWESESPVEGRLRHGERDPPVTNRAPPIASLPMAGAVTNHVQFRPTIKKSGAGRGV